jgi:hypothetical protein
MEYRRQKSRKALNTTCAGVALIILFLACHRGPVSAKIEPVKIKSVSRYIEITMPRKTTPAPLFQAVLDVTPVVMDTKYDSDYNPDRPFRRKFTDELRDGAISYFDRTGIFAAVKKEGGDLSLKMRVLSYEASRKSEPQKIALRVEVILRDEKKNQDILFGESGAESSIAIKELRTPITVTPPGTNAVLVMKRGAYELIQICLAIYQNIEKEVIGRREQILKTLR